jgi:hypothetical protein
MLVEYAMSSKTSLIAPLTLFFLMCATGTYAQSIPAGASCPTLPADAMDSLQWTRLQTDSALLCRAVRKDNGIEAFALTLTRKSPFKPVSSLREEKGAIQGKKMWWYRSEISGWPNELVRETLVKLDSNRIVHVFIRTSDANTLTRYQQVVQNLNFDAPSMATR